MSCDSAGGIGPKPFDRVHVDGQTLGKFTARVALMETVAVGAQPKCVSATLSVERRRIGLEIIKGICMESSSLGYKIHIMDSTENNFAVKQTGVGVTVVGLATSGSLRLARSKPADWVFAVGSPSVGREVLQNENRGLIAELGDVRKLTRSAFVHDVIPVGSHGIAYEADTLAKDSRLHFKQRPMGDVDLSKSAGPGTVVLCSAPPEGVTRIPKIIDKPVNVVGVLT